MAMVACPHYAISNSLVSTDRYRHALIWLGLPASNCPRGKPLCYYHSPIAPKRLIKCIIGPRKDSSSWHKWIMCANGLRNEKVGNRTLQISRVSMPCRRPASGPIRIPKRLLAIMMALSCTIFSCKCRAARAAEGVPVLSPKIRALWKLFWPKVLQVFGVFRDQGLIIAALLGMSAFFSMAETSITTLWPWKVQELAEKEPEDGVFRLLRQDVTRFLTTILIGTTVVNIGATALVTEAATTLFGEAGISAATGVMTVVVLLLTEITPKSIAVHNATEVARFVVRPVAWLSVVLYPVGRIVTALSMGLLKILGLKNKSEHLVTEEELKLMLRGAELSGTIEEEEQDMIENVLDFKETHVREVMTPLVDVVAIDCRATLMEFRSLWEIHQYSRVPVYESRIDNIVGIAYAMDMLDYVDQAELLERLTVGGIAHKPAYFVPDSMSIWNLLREFRIRKVHMAIVLNEYGGTIGIVTLEDVVEEIVGEIFDESDSKEEIQKKTGYVVERAAGVYDVDANTSIEDLAEALNVKLEESSYETVSGYICEAFGYIPRTGESMSVALQKEPDDNNNGFKEEDDHHEEQRAKYQKYKLEILSGNARKVGSVRFEEITGKSVKHNKVTHVSPQIVKQRWDYGIEAKEPTEEPPVVAPILVSKRKESGTHMNAYNVRSDDVEHASERKVVEIPESDLTVIPPEDPVIKVVDEADMQPVKTDKIDVTSTTSVRNLNEREQEKKQTKKRKKRRKVADNSCVDDGQGSVNAKQNEVK
eukprot:TRINITY_DN5976_c0_g2_i1.p1 TRINITY_DN5976_c0_g2~~TRINITY_DN5976_c0_g2_i1.p1  ORF type:complete len:762 (+),score=150.73 TRINITY_DN5976_c0_g2_i1:161-2446(+)